MDAVGNLIEERQVDNVVVTAGRRWVLEQINSTNHVANRSFSHIAVGTSTTAPTTANTGLASEAARLAIQNFQTSNLTSNPPSWQAHVSFATDQANTTLGEVGIFNSSSGGTMLARSTFSTIDKTTSNTLSITYTISG